jgi:hypothetical protein
MPRRFGSRCVIALTHDNRPVHAQTHNLKAEKTPVRRVTSVNMSSRSAAAVRRLKVSSASKLVELVVSVFWARQKPFRCNEDQKEAHRWQDAMVRIAIGQDRPTLDEEISTPFSASSTALGSFIGVASVVTLPKPKAVRQVLRSAGTLPPTAEPTPHSVLKARRVGSHLVSSRSFHRQSHIYF